MSDEENAQPISEPTPEPISVSPVENPTPNQSSQSSDDTGQVSEPNPVKLDSLTTGQDPAPVSPPTSPKASLDESKAPTSSEDPSTVKDQNPAPPSPEATAGQGNETFDSAQDLRPTLLSNFLCQDYQHLCLIF